MSVLDACKKDIETIKTKMGDSQFESFLICIAQFIDNTNQVTAISNHLNPSKDTGKEDYYSELNKVIFKADEAWYSIKELLKEINY